MVASWSCTGSFDEAFTAWLAALRQQAWIVYCKPPFAGPGHVLAYLGRYTHRVALSNDRLLAVADGRVRFRWRDWAAARTSPRPDSLTLTSDVDPEEALLM